MTHKLAFLFLVYDKINHEDLWIDFFNQDKQNRHNIYIHYKNNIPSDYFDKYKLDNCIETKWGDISLVKAQNLLLAEALKDADNKIFIFLSNSCVPFRSFNHVYKTLDVNYSYFNLFPEGQAFPRCNNTLKYIDKKYIKKASQWCILKRSHVECILSTDVYIEWFKNTIGDEHCYITYLHYIGLQDELKLTEHSPENATTFTNWYDMKYRFKTLRRSVVKNYNSISANELIYILKGKCLFGRKFSPTCNLNILRKIINL